MQNAFRNGLNLNKYAYILSVPGIIPSYNYLFSTIFDNFPSLALARGSNDNDEIQAWKVTRLRVWFEGLKADIAG